MKRILGGFFLFSLMAALVIFSGCSSPSSPDVPPQPFKVGAVYGLPGPAKDVSAQGDFAAVALGSSGVTVLNVRDLAHIDTVYHDTTTLDYAGFPTTGISRVAIDTLHHAVGWTTEPRDVLDANQIHNYLTRARITGVPSFQGPYYCFCIESEPNRMVFYGGVHNRFHTSSLCRDTDTSAWQRCPQPVESYEYLSVPSNTQQNRGQAFAHRKADKVIALAIEEAGVHFLQDSSLALISNVLIRGSAMDCAWYHDSLLVVAADIQMVIVNAKDPTHPYVVSEYQIPTSTHMRGVVVDGNWACMMDTYDGIYVVDVSNPRSPVNVQLLRLGAVTSICGDNGRLYATDESSGLVVYTK